MSITVLDEINDDIAAYWRGKKSWAKLGRVAKQKLCMPATSISSERSFSIAGRTLEKRRTERSPESVDGLIFLVGLMQHS